MTHCPPPKVQSGCGRLSGDVWRLLYEPGRGIECGRVVSINMSSFDSRSADFSARVKKYGEQLPVVGWEGGPVRFSCHTNQES